MPNRIHLFSQPLTRNQKLTKFLNGRIQTLICKKKQKLSTRFTSMEMLLKRRLPVSFWKPSSSTLVSLLRSTILEITNWPM